MRNSQKSNGNRACIAKGNSTIDRDDRITASSRLLHASNNRKAAFNPARETREVRVGEVNEPLLARAQTPERHHDELVGSPQPVGGVGKNGEAVELGGIVTPGDHGFDVVYRGEGLTNVDHAREERHGIRGGRWRAVTLHPGCAPAVHGLDGGGAPHITLEQWVIRKHDRPLLGVIARVERDTDVTR